MIRTENSPKHIHRGGTGVTNFDWRQQPLYEQAIKQFGDKDLSVGVPMAFVPGCGLLALHASSGKFPENMSDFWQIFEALRDA